MSSVEDQRLVGPINLSAPNVSTLTSGIDVLVEHTRSSEAFRACLNNPSQLRSLIVVIGTFVAVDVGFHSTAQELGKILENILAQDHDEQRDFLSALCAAQNLTPLQDKQGNIRTGRPGLIHALFSAHPELLRSSGKDSLAGKRFNYYLAQGKKTVECEMRSELVEREKSLRMSPLPIGAPDGATFRQMWAAASDDQRITLTLVAERANLPIKRWRRECEVIEEQKKRRRESSGRPSVLILPPTNRGGRISLEARARAMRQNPVTIWLTGFSGAGKSTLAFALESRLVAQGHVCAVLDGDIVRSLLNTDLGFTPDDRAENIRRGAAMARLMNDCGLVVITAFISPYLKDREMARGIIGTNRFLEVYLSTELSVCKRRDPKGLYAKALSGRLREFTGVSAPYERPLEPQLTIDTANRTIEDCTEALMNLLAPHFSKDHDLR